MPDSDNPETVQAPAQAQGPDATTPSFITKEDLAEFRDGMFADIRKVMKGFAKQPPSAPTEVATKVIKQEVASSTPDVVTREELARTLQARDAFHAAASQFRLSEGARARMLRDFERDRPEDATGWVKGYVADFGLNGAGESPTQATPRTGPPASNGGPPAPVTASSDQIEPWRRSEDDVQALIRRKGMSAAGSELRSQYRTALRGRRIRLK